MNNSIKNIIDKCKGNFNIERLNQYIDAFNNKKRGEYIFVTCIDIQLWWWQQRWWLPFGTNDEKSLRDIKNYFMTWLFECKIVLKVTKVKVYEFLWKSTTCGD